MVLRCPICMAMSPQGTPACPSCHTSLAGIVPTPSAVPLQGQQQGGLGGFLQGSGGQMAVGALGGAAAVIGGEMLLHGLNARESADVTTMITGIAVAEAVACSVNWATLATWVTISAFSKAQRHLSERGIPGGG